MSKNSTVVSVLLKPAWNDPHGLLAIGLCGAVPPSAWLDSGAEIWRANVALDEPPGMEALPLFWEGEAVPEGMDRAHRVHKGFGEPLHSDATIERVIELALRFGYLGALLYLDAEGREVKT